MTANIQPCREGTEIEAVNLTIDEVIFQTMVQNKISRLGLWIVMSVLSSSSFSFLCLCKYLKKNIKKKKLYDKILREITQQVDSVAFNVVYIYVYIKF